MIKPFFTLVLEDWDKELITQLQSFGYMNYGSPYPEKYTDNRLITMSDGYYASTNIKDLNIEKINCKSNKFLFLLMAEVMIDEEYGKWFYHPETKEEIYCDRQDWIDMYSCLCVGQRENTKNHMKYLDEFIEMPKEMMIEKFKNTKDNEY